MASPPLLLSLADDFSRLTPFYEPVVSTGWPAITTSPSGQFRKFERDLPITSVGKDGFQASMDVQQFKPCELNVKVVDDHIVVEGNHEERTDGHGYISRHFIRRFELPKGFDADKMVSTLSSDGVLTVCVAKPAIEDKDKSNELVIQIKQTVPALLYVKDSKDNPKENPKEENAKV